MSNQWIGVIGAGLMGHGIALTFAKAGYRVAIHDPVQAARDGVKARISESLTIMGEAPEGVSAVLDRVEVRDTLAGTVQATSTVFEAAPEKMELKQAIFAEIEAHAPSDAILASNTSVMPITQIMSKLQNKGRAIGTHWWNPPHLIPLVEVVRTEWTEDAVAETAMALLLEAGKTPVLVAKDVPGFIGNRLQHALWREAISLVERGICDAASVDTVIKNCFGRRLSVLGPLENADLVGLDLTLDIHSQVLADLEARQGPSPLLEEMVREGRIGMKSGRGFYDWTPEEASAVRSRVSTHLQKLETILPE
ncbi:3-hydroxyacyl-CoA dehydrogenase family protein [Roseibium litorale]|uniref:3-hydroxyacyl-CoA dehydrogenase family protein n=1 Tax=Roseibium litorale TaxID=2803841 RepID=A0ABR9CR82_9HYPH|nr:3-hydroxyacyl-CoA dehydrogenase family protein [Roseibium litorale]MBD8893385.1 3-hydroxyacyl-CoA dehydrogenase family protein [Roseibium litorale]